MPGLWTTRPASGSPSCGAAGWVASVDGLRFRAPVQTVQADSSPQFLGYRRGIAWLNAVNDRFAGLGAVIVTAAVRDSLYILDQSPRRVCQHGGL